MTRTWKQLGQFISTATDTLASLYRVVDDKGDFVAAFQRKEDAILAAQNHKVCSEILSIMRTYHEQDAGGTIARIERETENAVESLRESPARSVKPAASQWYDYDPENPSDEIEEGRWHLIEYKEGAFGDLWLEASRWCNQRHWMDCDTAVVTRFARIWL